MCMFENKLCSILINYVLKYRHSYQVDYMNVDDKTGTISQHRKSNNLTTIELTMWLAVCVATDSYNDWCQRYRNRRLCSRPHSHESMIFSVFLAFIVFKLRPLCWIYECACNELMRLAVVVGADWTLHPWRLKCWGVTAGQTGHNSSNIGGCHCGPGQTQL